MSEGLLPAIFYLMHPFWGHSKSRNGKWEKKKGKCRAVGTGPASLAAAGPIFGQPTCTKMLYELQRVVWFSLQENTSRDLGRELSYERFLAMEANTLFT